MSNPTNPPDYEDLYRRLFEIPDAQRVWTDVLASLEEARITGMNCQKHNFRQSGRVEVRIPHREILDFEFRVEGPLGSEKFLLHTEPHSYGARLVSRSRLIDEIVSPHLGVDVPRLCCRKKIVEDGSNRSDSFHVWMARKAYRTLRAITARRLNGRDLDSDELAVLRTWRRTVRTKWKAKTLHFMKNNLSDVPNDLLQECFDEFIVAQAMES